MNDLVKFKERNNILVLGGSGQIGSEIRNIISEDSFFFPKKKELDLRSEVEIIKFFKKNNFDLILNLAAFTDVDNAENKKEEALSVNHIGAKIIARESFKKNIGLIHISTDYVFGKSETGPFNVDSPKNPINYYGITKSLGEDDVLLLNNKSMIVRLASVFSEYGNNFIKTIIKLILSKRKIEVVSDQLISISSAKDFADNLNYLISLYLRNIDNSKNRVIHFTNKGFATWYDVAKVVLEEIKKDRNNVNCELIPIKGKNWISDAKRPKDSRLFVNFPFLEENNIFLTNWEDSVRKTVNKML